MTKKFTSLLLLAGGFALTAQNALASPPQSNVVVLGQPPITDFSEPIPFSFTAISSPRSSLCCTALAGGVDAQVTGVAATDSTAQTFSYRGTVAPAVPAAAADGTAADKSRVCLIPTASALSVTAGVDSSSMATTFNAIEISCEDTTMAGGFNTVVTQLNYLEIANNTGQEVHAHIWAFKSSGEVLVDQTLTLPGSATGARRVDVDLHTLVGPDVFGTLILATDAPKGSIVADVAQYKITSVTPLDFDLVAHNPLFYRGQSPVGAPNQPI